MRHFAFIIQTVLFCESRVFVLPNERLFHLLMLAANGHSVNMHRYRNYYFWSSCAARQSARRESGLDALPLGPPILEPDFHLHFAEVEGMSDLRSLSQGEILLGVKFFLQLKKLFACEGGSSAATFPVAGSVFLVPG